MLPLAAVNVNLVGFSVLATLCVLCAVGVVLSKNPIWSALCLVGTFFLIAILYFTLQADMLGVTQIVVYAGAIMVLFLFILMVLNPARSPVEKPELRNWVAGILGLALIVAIGSQVVQALAGPSDINAPSHYGEPLAIGRVLFTSYAYPFEAISMLLLIGIVGSILLAKRRLR
jgi:NADH-quinone oxidoreductase subunit J